MGKDEVDEEDSAKYAILLDVVSYFDLKVDFFTISSPCFILQKLLSQCSWKPLNFITFFDMKLYFVSGLWPVVFVAWI